MSAFYVVAKAAPSLPAIAGGTRSRLHRSVVHELAEWAGFSACTELQVEHDFFRAYRLDR